MLGFYIVSAIVGGVLILVNVISGGHSHDFDVHADAPDLDHGGHDIDHSLWLPFFSLRFWTYFFGAMGVTGLLLTYLTRATEPSIGILAGVTGLACGMMVVVIMRYLRRYDSNSSANLDELLGLEAKVLVTVRQNTPGKIRCAIKGETLDLLALSQEDSVIEAGSDAIIVAIEDDRARVVPRAVLFD